MRGKRYACYKSFIANDSGNAGVFAAERLSGSRLKTESNMTDHDQAYYSRRERQERDCAKRCDDHGARLVHLELAARYSAMLRDIMAKPAGSVAA